MRVRARIIRQRDAGADADVENAARRRRSAAAIEALRPRVEHRAEHEVIDRRPARIGLGDRVAVDFDRHRRSTSSTAIRAQSLR